MLSLCVRYRHTNIYTYIHRACIYIFIKLICFVIYTKHVISVLMIIHFVIFVPCDSRNIRASGIVHVPRVLFPLVESFRERSIIFPFDESTTRAPCVSHGVYIGVIARRTKIHGVAKADLRSVFRTKARRVHCARLRNTRVYDF